MANCVSCGRELPAFSFGEISDRCPDCRKLAISTAASSSQTSTEFSAPVASRGLPRVTSAILAINVAVFLIMAVRGVSPSAPNTQQLLDWGADWGPLSLGSQPWRMLSSNYVHIGFMHILLNMWCLWDLGKLSERIFDGWTYFLTYTACGLAGSIASLWWHPMVVGAGASGAIFGLAGALISALYLGHLPIPRQAIQKTLRSLVVFAGYNLFFGAVGAGIDNSAHVGGFATGLVLGAVMARRLMAGQEERSGWRRYVFTSGALVLVLGFGLVREANGYVVQRQSAAQEFDRGHYDQAIGLAQAALQKNSRDAFAHGLLGASYLEKKRYDEAERSLQEALAIQPDYAFAEFELGRVYLVRGRYEDARVVLSNVVEQYPKDGGAWLLLGTSLENLGREPEAVTAYRKGTLAEPQNGEAQRLLGEALLKTGQQADAIAALKKAVEIDPKNADSQLALGHAYASKGMGKESEEAIRKAAELKKAASPQ